MSEERDYSEYLGELRGLEEFRARYHGRYPSTPLEPEEPGVQRILEAIAYFSSRTRQATEASMEAATRRLFDAYFDHLLFPLPARGLIEGAVGERMVDPRDLGRGTEVRVTAAGGVFATFHTEADLHVLPIWLERARVHLRPEGGYRLVLRFQSRFQRQESIGTLPLLVRYLDDYLSSLELYHQLRAHLARTSVVYDVQADETSRGETCQTFFGPLPVPRDREVTPLGTLRSFFQYPQADLYLHVTVPERRQGSGWTAFSLCFDLRSGWREADRSSAELFHLFTVPVSNLHREAALPITSDGMRTAYPVIHPDTRRHFRLHSVISVQDVQPTGREPLRRSFLPGATGAEFEVELPADGPDTETPATVLVHQPAAFEEPRTLAIDCRWHQPWFQAHAIGRMDASLPGQHLEGLKLRLLGNIVPWQDSPLRKGSNLFAELLALKMRSALTLEEIRLLLRILCPSDDSPYARLPARIVALSSRSIPAGGRDDAGVRRRYSLTLDRFEPEEEGLMWTFLTRLRDLLDAWSAEGPVELEVAAPGSTPSPLFLEEFTA